MEVSSFFKASLEETIKRVGDGGKVLTRGEEDSSQRGLPSPCLALSYLFHSYIIPFGKILGLAGPKASMKSAFGFALGAYAAMRGGGYHLVETEDKLSVRYMNSFFPDHLLDRINVDYVTTLEDAQSTVTKVIQRYASVTPKNPFPLVLGIDSLAGSGTKAEYAKMNKSGYAERNFPEAALLWSPYFKKLSSDLAGLDILLYFTNHLKEKPAEPGGGWGKQYTKQGGSAQDFHAAQYLNFNKIENIDQVAREGKLIQIRADKCGLGPDNRKIQIPVLWNYERSDEDEPVQRTYWDWSAATSKMLADGSKVVLPKRIQSELDVKCSSNKYSSKELKVTGLSDTEFGDVVHAHKDYCEGFRKLCGYNRWTDIGTDPEKQEV